MSEAGKATRGGRQKSSSQKAKSAACVVAATGKGVPLAQSESIQVVHAARGGAHSACAQTVTENYRVDRRRVVKPATGGHRL